jgi:hypothetical protein
MASVGLQYIRTFQDLADDRPGAELGCVGYAVTRSEWQASNLNPSAGTWFDR